MGRAEGVKVGRRDGEGVGRGDGGDDGEAVVRRDVGDLDGDGEGFSECGILIISSSSGKPRMAFDTTVDMNTDDSVLNSTMMSIEASA